MGFGKPVNKYLEHNRALEQSPDFKRIEKEVEKEVYTQFALQHIKEDELNVLDRSFFEGPKTTYKIGNEPNSSGKKPLKPLADDVLARYEEYLRERSNRIKEAKRLLELYPNEPERAANLYMKLGSCHYLWGMKKRILKEKYGITWYAISEIYPDTCFD